MRDEGRSEYSLGATIEDLKEEVERLKRELFCVRNSQTAELAATKDENERLRAELAEWKHRAIGGTCRILSEGDKCECAICFRDRKLAAFNTTWQHSPPEVGDTKWVRLRVVESHPRLVVEGDEE